MAVENPVAYDAIPLDAVQEVLADRFGDVEPRTTRKRATPAEIVRAVRGVVRTVTLALEVPGVHYSGLEYDHLLEILASQGRDFDADTETMRSAILAEVSLELENLGRMPTAKAIREAVARAALAWILKRMTGKVRDVRIRRLTMNYARAKRAAGYGGRPIGIRTGSLALRVAEFGRVKVTP